MMGRPYYSDEWLTVYQGDCRAVMAELPAESVHCVVTSPPYWGLRDYGNAGQLGLEATPEEYVANLVDVFREVRRVLRSDGTVWLNLGDAYAGSWGAQSRGNHTGDDKTTLNGHEGGLRLSGRQIAEHPRFNLTGTRALVEGRKPKDLIGLPWMVAFALRSDGWYLRSDIIWAKPNPMPESVTDRPTKSHEYLFLLSKSPRYYYDADAVREPDVARPQRNHSEGVDPRSAEALERVFTTHGRPDHRTQKYGTGRNLRSVWTVPTQPYPGAHFATFPRKLVEPCVKAGTSERGVCPDCGAPWVRVVEREKRSGYNLVPHPSKARDAYPTHSEHQMGQYRSHGESLAGETGVTTGWRTTCRCCPDGRVACTATTCTPIPATVLDPFAGSGTTGAVAQSLNRRAVLIDLNGDYLTQAMGRNRDIPLGLAG